MLPGWRRSRGAHQECEFAYYRELGIYHHPDAEVDTSYSFRRIR